MKKLTRPLLALLLLSTLPALAADQEMSYPEEGPIVTVVIPDGWIHGYDDGALNAASSGDLETLLTLKPLLAKKSEGSAALEEIKAPLDEAYEGNITHSEVQEGGAENLGLYVVNSKAKMTANDGETNIFINSVMITFPDTDQILLLQVISTEAGSEKNGEAIDQILKSIKKAA